jgi:tetratricopeptide (TPR) repeat protein
MLNTRRDVFIVGILLSVLGLSIALHTLNPLPLTLPMLKAQQDDPSAYFRRGNRYQNSHPGFAITYYSTAIELDPSYVEAYYQRSIAYARVGNYTDAFADLDRVIELEPDVASHYFSRANLYKQVGNLEQALGDYSQAIAIDPAYLAAYFNRANTYYELGNTAEALADYEHFLDQYARQDGISMMARQRVQELTRS